MREFKFRSWSLIGKRFWFFDIHTGFNAENSGRFTHPEQFTGLQDKDGADIYEGDLIKNKTGRICEVVFNEYCAAFDCEVKVDGGKNSEAYGFKNSLWKTQVIKIGNIHENPELLEQMKCQ